MSHIYAAFKEICSESRQPSTWYVCLCSNQRCYGGPEEGGWWYDACELYEYQAFSTEETARNVADRVRKMAEEMTAEDRRARGEACLRSLEWLEARGLEPDYLPEPNGEEEFYVMVTQELPQFENSKPRYE